MSPLASPSLDLSLRAEPHDTGKLVDDVLAGETEAKAVFYRRHAREVACALAAVMGPDAEIADLLHEVFIEAFAGLSRLRNVESVGPWLRQIAVHRARRCLRRRKRLRYLATLGLVEPVANVATPEVREALAETYRILEALPVDLRLAFTLRYIEGLELVDVALACQVSLATIKRRLVAANAGFRRLAAKSGKLDGWLPPLETP